MKKTVGITDEIRIKRCYGCGAILQSTDPKKVGYIREDKMKEEEYSLIARKSIDCVKNLIKDNGLS